MALLLALFACALEAKVKIEFYLRDDIEERILELNQPQVLLEKAHGSAILTLTGILLDEGLNSIDVNFSFKIVQPNGRKVTHDFETETIPLNRIIGLKKSKFTEHLIVKAIKIN